MGAATVSFFASASVAVSAGLIAVTARAGARSLAGFAIALAGLVLPLVQLRAPMVAGVMLLLSAITIALLGGLHALTPAEPGERPRADTRTRVFWGLAGLGLLGFVWVLLATGSRQVVEPPPTLTPGASFGDGTSLLVSMASEHLVASLIVGLLALCSVIAAVLTLVAEPPEPAGPVQAGPPEPPGGA